MFGFSRPSTFHFLDMCQEVRDLMASEIEWDEQHGGVYRSKRIVVAGQERWVALLRVAVAQHEPPWLIVQLSASGLLLHKERPFRRGQRTPGNVPRNAAQTLAEDQFNRYYIRGVCRLALNREIPEVVAYRAQRVSEPRAMSRSVIGRRFAAQTILDDVRVHQEETTHGIPGGSNSGVSVCLPDTYKTLSGSI